MMEDIVGDGNQALMIEDASDVGTCMVISDSDAEFEILDHDTLFRDVVFVPAPVADAPCPGPTTRLSGKRSCFDLTAPCHIQVNNVMHGYVVL